MFYVATQNVYLAHLKYFQIVRGARTIKKRKQGEWGKWDERGEWGKTSGTGETGKWGERGENEF